MAGTRGGKQDGKPIKVLLVDDGHSDCNSIGGSLGKEQNFEYNLVRPENLHQAMDIKDDESTIVLLAADPTLKQVKTILKRIPETSANVPVLIVPNCGGSSETRESSQQIKRMNNQLDQKMARFLRRSLRRLQLRSGLAHLALTDDLTGLYNRQGFLLFGSERMKMASGIKKNLLLFFADLDNLKEINDRFGPQEGDRALVKTGDIFRKTFRNSDLTARFGGDEFTALVVEDMGQSAESISRRLQKNMDHLAAAEDRYQLSLSVGMTRYVAETRASLKKLLAQAAQSQNEQIRAKRAEANTKSVLAFPVPADGAARTTFRVAEACWHKATRRERKTSARDS